jgi:hypothetical protein
LAPTTPKQNPKPNAPPNNKPNAKPNETSNDSNDASHNGGEPQSNKSIHDPTPIFNVNRSKI